MALLIPTELVIEIFRHAAAQFVAEDRPTVVHVAQASKMAYKVVAPVLYRTLWITVRNFPAVQRCAALSSFQRICGRVRHLIMFYSDHQREIPLDLFTSVESVTAYREVLERLSPVCSSLRMAHVWTSDLDDARESLPMTLRQNITHLAGDVSYSDSYISNTSLWLNGITQDFTGLTHLAFEVVHLPHEADFVMAAFEALLRVALIDDKLQRVVLRIAGACCAREAELEQVVYQISDARLRIWCDKRPIRNWSDDEELTIEDALHQRDIWTKAVPTSLLVPDIASA
ncbi:hypothetical protein BKA62DRAFT_352538 [Auriculariales sp. MPI-PUGE-AT-0066]|nr:hypothetical protein BKA62DRAFT_352538 [Auriculariales sp. MPI-PUGE-AT-0066]